MINCGSDKNVLGTKTGKQCLEAVTIMYILAKENQSFESLEAFAEKAKWDAAAKGKGVAPLWEIYEFANENGDASFYESGNFKARTKKAIKKYSAEVYLSFCGHKILKSYDSSLFTRVYEVTEDGEIIGVLQSDGKVKGQLLKEFTVGIRNNATNDKVPNTKISMTFADYEELENNPAIVAPNFNPVLDLDGIEQVNLAIETNPAPSETGFLFSVKSICGFDSDEILPKEAFTITNGDGSEVTPTTISKDNSTQLYEVTATGLSGVVTLKVADVYETTEGDLFQSETVSTTV